MHPNISYPAFAIGVQHRSNVAVARVPPKDFPRRAIGQVERSAVLKIQPPFPIGRPFLATSRERPVDLDYSISGIVDLSTILFDLPDCVVAVGDEAEARLVACKKSAQAETKVAAAVVDEIAQRWSEAFGFVPGFIEVFRVSWSAVFMLTQDRSWGKALETLTLSATVSKDINVIESLGSDLVGFVGVGDVEVGVCASKSVFDRVRTAVACPLTGVDHCTHTIVAGCSSGESSNFDVPESCREGRHREEREMHCEVGWRVDF